MRAYGKATERCYTESIATRRKQVPVVYFSAPVEHEDINSLAQVRVSTLDSTYILLAPTSIKIPPYIELQKAAKVQVSICKSIPQTASMIEHETTLSTLGSNWTCLLRSLAGGSRTCTFAWRNDRAEESCGLDISALSVVRAILLRYFTEYSIKSFVHPSIVSGFAFKVPKRLTGLLHLTRDTTTRGSPMERDSGMLSMAVRGYFHDVSYPAE